jgi:hypothetical protein
MDDDTRKAVARLEQEGTQALELAALYARTLESLARRMQSAAAVRLPRDNAALRSSALRLDHAATEALAVLVAVIVQSARLDMLATIRPILEPKNTDRQ